MFDEVIGFFQNVIETVREMFSKATWWQKGIVAGIVAVLIIGAQIQLQSGLPVISGYDGLIAGINEVDSDNVYSEFNNYTAAGVIQNDYWTPLFVDPAGVKLEVQAGVDVMKYDEVLFSDSENTTEGDFVHDKKWEVRRVECKMGATVSTYSGGLDAAYDITFWVELSENQFSVFTAANESYAYILQVYTLEVPTLTGIMNVIPENEGFNFGMTPIEQGNVPAWLEERLPEIGLQRNSLLEKVKFPIVVQKAQPTSFWYQDRAESRAVFSIGIDVLLAGHWHYVIPEKDWKEQPEPDPWYQGILDFLKTVGLTILAPMIVLAVVALLCVREMKK